MSFHFYLYRGPAALPPIAAWERNRAESIGLPADVRAALTDLLLSVEWRVTQSGSSWATAHDPRYDTRYTLSTIESGGAAVFITTDNHASPFTMAKIMDRFRLNYCCTEFGDFRDPHACSDDWKPVARSGAGESLD